MESLVLLTEKIYKRVNSRTCENGGKHSEWMCKEEYSSLTAASELVLLMGVIDTK